MSLSIIKILNKVHMKYMIAILFLSTIISCSKDKLTPTYSLNLVSNRISLRIQSSDGTDMLNKQNKEHYKKSDILVLESKDKQSSVSINKYTDGDYYSVQLHLNYNFLDEIKGINYTEEVITKVIFGNEEPDEIKGLYEVECFKGINEEGYGTGRGYNITLQKAWFNGKQIYDKQDRMELPIIVKTGINR